MIQDSYIYKDSIIHKINPSIKMISVIFFIILIFVPYGFLFQLILISIIFGIYFAAKLPFKRLWKIFVSILFMALLLTLINWVSYKTPGAIFDFNSSFAIFKNPFWLNSNNPNLIFLDGKWFGHGDIWGGIIETNLSSQISSLLEGTNASLNSFGNGFYVIDINSADINDIERLLNGIIGSNGKTIINEFAIESGQLYMFSYSTEWYAISSFSLGLMAYVTLKIFAMILIITILTSTTSSIEMTYAIEDILSPLRYLKAPISEWSMTISLSIRFIPSLLDEANRVLNAQASRGVDFRNGNGIDKIKSLASLVVPLFSIAFRKADELSNAMEARAYDPRSIRTRYRIFSIKYIDIIFFALVLIYFGFVITLIFIKDKPILITPFGILDALMIKN
ncbi:MAG: energy-coupling factor transporter transmembrane component T family protein [Mycoplasmoidaceae bacterium]